MGKILNQDPGEPLAVGADNTDLFGPRVQFSFSQIHAM